MRQIYIYIHTERERDLYTVYVLYIINLVALYKYTLEIRNQNWGNNIKPSYYALPSPIMSLRPHIFSRGPTKIQIHKICNLAMTSVKVHKVSICG